MAKFIFLHQRIANALGWTVEDTQKFNLHMLREMVRDKDSELARDISVCIRTGNHIFGESVNRSNNG
jgi:hypothetical protein